MSTHLLRAQDRSTSKRSEAIEIYSFMEYGRYRPVNMMYVEIMRSLWGSFKTLAVLVKAFNVND
jgi:hypothetical protein